MRDEASEGGAEADVQVRLELRAEHLGLRPPPLTVHVRIASYLEDWLIHVWNADGVRKSVLNWLSSFVPAGSKEHVSKRPRLITLQASELPEPLTALFDAFDVDLLVMDPSGTVRVVMRGSRDEIRGFLDGLTKEAGKATLERLGPTSKTTGVLTDRQREALHFALREGYYDVPRRVHLETLASKLDVSEGSLSELLRRAESRVLWAFVEGDVGPAAGDMDDEDTLGGEDELA